MATFVGFGTSEPRNPRLAGKEAVAQALPTAGGEQADRILSDSNIGHDHAPLITPLRPPSRGAASAILFCGEAFTLNDSAIKKGIAAEIGTARFIPFLGGGTNRDVASTRTFQLHNDALALL